MNHYDSFSLTNRKSSIRLHALYSPSTAGHLGGVVVSALATGLKGCWFEPGQGDDFLRVIKIRSTPSFSGK
jgi:hypothetical protein